MALFSKNDKVVIKSFYDQFMTAFPNKGSGAAAVSRQVSGQRQATYATDENVDIIESLLVAESKIKQDNMKEHVKLNMNMKWSDALQHN